MTVAIAGAGISICWPLLPEHDARVADASSTERLPIASDEIDFIVSLSSLFIIPKLDGCFLSMLKRLKPKIHAKVQRKITILEKYNNIFNDFIHSFPKFIPFDQSRKYF